MKKAFLRIMSVLLCLSLMVPLVTVSASAVAVETILGILATITASANAVKSLADAASGINQMISDIKGFTNDSTQDSCSWLASNAYLGAAGNRTETTKDVLAWIAQDWNRNYYEKTGMQLSLTTVELDDGIVYSALQCFFGLNGGSRSDLNNTRWFFCDGHGRILCSNDTSELDGHWEPFYKQNSLVYFVSYESLYNKAQEIDGYLVRYRDYWAISSKDGERGWFTPSGQRLVARYNSNGGGWASDQERPDTSVKDEDGNQIEGLPEENTTNIDFSGMTITLPDGSINFIDNLIYDESTKTYHIDSHDTIYEGDTYITNNYYYEWNYHINYTSITYIGQTEEYNKYYEVYYELPDGRDSADLTREELEQLNVSIDVVPYGRSADDTSLRSLYHFDGDTRDSSYWNYCTDFTWNKGASLTYMDSAVFNGALYLDEQEHDFTLTLPSNITAGDFTLQFRYYQSYTAAPQTDSYIKLGDSIVFQFNGSQFLNGSGTALANTPIGSWNEIALIRHSGTLYYYLNGVSIGSVSTSVSYSNTITFHFGSSQQTYKYFDELRFLNYAFQNGGANYTPSSVPHDTNLSLVLPTDSVPVADEYWDISSSGDNLFRYDVSTGTYPSPNFSITSSSYFSTPPSFPNWGYSTSYCSTNYYDGYFTFSTSSNNLTISMNDAGSSRDYRWIGSNLCTSLWYYYYRSPSGVFQGDKYSYLEDGSYVLSVVFGDGSIYSFPFTFKIGSPVRSSVDFDWGTIGLYWFSGFYDYDYGARRDLEQVLYIMPKAGTSIDIRHIELIKGTETDLKSELVTSVTPMTPDQLNTPTLAVRTDLDITSYQIGGVRPSLPKKGQVWAMVESGYITSIQIYNGQAWEGCDGRIWTGERWVPARSYNVITMQDMYDIVDSTPNYEYIYSESGFWSWWQKSWNAFTEKLFSILGSGGSGSGGSSSAPSSVKDALANALSSLIEGVFSLITEVLKSLIGAATDLISGFFGFLSETVLGGVKDFFSSLGELVNPFQSTVTNEDGSTTPVTELPDGVSTVFAFFSGLLFVIPDDLRMILMFGIGLMVLLAVFKMVKE